MATSPETVLLTLASVIVLGFLGQLFFRKTRLSDILILIAFGVLLGYGINEFQTFDTATFAVLAPIVGTFALLVILFEGGLDLRFRDLVHGLGRALIIAVLGFGLTVLGVAAVAVYVLGLDWLHGALLGTILGGSSSIAVMPIVKRLPISDQTRVVLSVESALTDVFCVVGALTVASVIAVKEAQPDVAGVGQDVLNGFIVAIAVGGIVGVFWLKLLDSRFFEGVRYMVTLAMILILHVAVTNLLDGNGPVAVLTFGVILGNAISFRRMIRIKNEAFTKPLRAFQSEVAFVTRAFFFVYLGLILPLDAFTLEFVMVALAILAALAVARAIAVFAASAGSKDMSPDRAVSWSMMPRGLAAAVLASVPALTFGIEGTEDFVGYAALTIILTNALASLAGFLAPKVGSGSFPAVEDGDEEADGGPSRVRPLRRTRARKARA